MRKAALICRIILSFILILTMLPIGSRIVYADNNYTVILNPGDGTGEQITYTCPFSDYDSLPSLPEEAGHLKFYKEQNKVVGFNLNADYCPDSFTAPENYLFDGWDANGVILISQGNPTVTITAKWKVDQTRTYGPIAGIPKVSGGYVYLGGIRWRVIGQNASSWLLISADVLGGYMTWDAAKAYCGTVYESFTPLEQDAVIPTTKEDHDYTTLSVDNFGTPYNHFAADLNNATLFLLSAAEAEFYFTDDGDRASNYMWWLRSKVANTDDNAGFFGRGGGMKSQPCGLPGAGARPAFQFDPASVLFSSAAEGGKSSVAAGSSEFGSFRASSEQGIKLTLSDSSRNGFTATQAGNVCSGGSLAVLYSNAKTGTNEYVSAMICDASGTPLYYASVPSEGSGTMNLTMPAYLAAGSSYTMKVFSEQLNGDYATDYAGGFNNITLNTTEAYTITFKNYDGTALQTGVAAAGQTPVYKGETPEKPSDAQQTGYVFDGWDPAIGPVTGDTTYTAQFREESKNLISFDANGGNGTMADDSYFVSQGTYTLPPCGFTAPEGYVFRDWTVTWENGNGSSSSTTRIAGSTLTGLTGDITVTANWIELSLKVSPIGAGTAVYENGAFTATANEGYTFDHWEYTNDQNSASPDGTVWPTDNPYQPSEVSYKIYTAVFTANEYTLTIQDNIQNGTVAKYSGTPKTGNTIKLNVTPDEGYRLALLSYTPEGGTAVSITETDKNGRYLFTMPAANVTITATFIMPARDVTVTANYNNRPAQNDPSPYIPASPSVPSEDPVFINPFLDVPEGSYFYDAVMWALQKGITAGTSEDYFSPGMPCSRAQMVTFLWRAAGLPEPATTENPFSDLSENVYYYKAVLWAYENGITMGTADGTFDPNGTVTRAQCITFLFRALHGKAAADNSFPDIDPNAYYYEAVLWAAENGITFGTDGGKFSPNDDCIRTQIVTFLYRAYRED